MRPPEQQQLDGEEVVPVQNEYMQMVQQEAKDVERELWAKKRKVVPQVQSARSGLSSSAMAHPAAPGGGGGAPSSHQLGVRITGWWPFQSVVVPPNVYVIHTRRGYEEPLQVGLGISFGFNPYKDSFLVVPSAMQTITINARSICQELQGVLIQAYVQWIIDDIEVAYRKLDFSDLEDPMRVVNIQLREQAEAAIKDKVATMPISEVLSDKQPIIAELTRRLKTVAEGAGEGKEQGLGISIVTVQIKEAVVSSTSVWENLQKPYRAERRTAARLAEIEAERSVTERELAERERRETAELESRTRYALLEQDRRLEQDRKQSEQEVERQKLAEGEVKARLARELAEKSAEWEVVAGDQVERDRLEKEALEARLERERSEHEVRNAQTEREIEFEERRQQTENIVSDELVRLRAVEQLPEIARSLPRPDKLTTVAVGEDRAGLGGVVASVLGVLEAYGVRLGRSGGEAPEPALPPEERAPSAPDAPGP